MEIPMTAPSIPEELRKGTAPVSKISDDEVFRELVRQLQC